jgi:hypothetical protein
LVHGSGVWEVQKHGTNISLASGEGLLFLLYHGEDRASELTQVSLPVFTIASLSYYLLSLRTEFSTHQLLGDPFKL